MTKATTASRLQALMKQRSLRQVDILHAALPYAAARGVKLNKSELGRAPEDYLLRKTAEMHHLY